MVSMVKGLKHVGLDLTFEESLFYSALVALVVTMVGISMITRLKVASGTAHEELASVREFWNPRYLYGLLDGVRPRFQ